LAHSAVQFVVFATNSYTSLFQSYQHNGQFPQNAYLFYNLLA